MMKDQGLPALTVVLTMLHAGGKFGQGGYKVSGGLHGVGVSVVNALSEWLVAEVYRDGKTYRQEFTRGVPDDDMKTIGISQETGTLISFLPDAEIFEEIEWSTDTLSQSLRETAFLTRGLRITLTDERAGGQRFEYHYEGGIRDFVAHVNEAKDPVHKHIVYFEGSNGEGEVEVAMQWNTKYVPSGEGRQPRGRGRPRGPRRGHLREAAGPTVRGSDEDEARQRVDARVRRADRERASR